MAAIAAATEQASLDPTRPVFHLLPPAQWMNDVCGTIHHRGWYHVCYLINPFGDHIAREHTWGHARSRDLVHWEHLPLPFWPAGTAGEEGIYIGGAAINGHRQPMFFWFRGRSPMSASCSETSCSRSTCDGCRAIARRAPAS